VDLGLQNQVAIIFGGTSGVGLATARYLQAEGAKVAIGGRSPERMAAALDSFAQGAPVLGKTVDVTVAAEVAEFVDAVLARWGRVDVVVNAAGQSLMRPFFAVDDADWHSQWALKVMAVVYAVRAVVPAMQAQGGGVIINLNSTLASEPEPRLVTTGAARAGLLNLTKALARELAPHRIRVNTVSLGLIRTDLWERRRKAEAPDEPEEAWYAELARSRNIPLGTVGRPEDVAAAIAFLASAQARYITGATLEVSGGVSRHL